MSRSAARIAFRPAEAGDIAYLAANLREADRQEVIASRGEDTPFADIIGRSVLRSSHVWVAATPTHPVAVFGAAPISLLEGIGSPWFLATEEAFEYPRNLVKDGRRYLSRMQRAYARLYNHVDARNDRSIRWLERLGFTIHPPTPYGPYGMPFHKFEIERTDGCTE